VGTGFLSGKIVLKYCWSGLCMITRLGAAAWPSECANAKAGVLQFVAFAWNHVGVFRLTHARPDRAVDGAAI
jgi:hypothetical protein